METKITVYHPAPVLLALSAALAAPTGSCGPSARPPGRWSWPSSAAWPSCSSRWRGAGPGTPSGVRSFLPDSMLAIALSLKLAAALGAAAHDDLAERATMVILGAFIVATGTRCPRPTPLSVLRCEAAVRAQALHRFAGWAWVFTGLALSVAWLALPSGSPRA